MGNELVPPTKTMRDGTNVTIDRVNAKIISSFEKIRSNKKKKKRC